MCFLYDIYEGFVFVLKGKMLQKEAHFAALFLKKMILTFLGEFN
jgi:hypothetical protein